MTETLPDIIDIKKSPQIINADIKSGAIKKDKGWTRLGTGLLPSFCDTLIPISNRSGSEYLLAKCGTELLIWDEINEVYNIIATGLIDADRPGNVYFDDVLYLCNINGPALKIDFSKVTRLNGAITIGATSIALKSTASLPTSGQVYINNVIVSYSGISPLLDQSQLTQDSSVAFGKINTTGSNNRIAQLFTPTTAILDGVHLYKAADTGTFTGTVTIGIYQIILPHSTDGLITENLLGSVSYTNAQWLVLPTGDFTAIVSTGAVTMVPGGGNQYWIVISCSTSDDSNHPNLGINSVGGYAGGNFEYWNGGDQWVTVSTESLYFETFSYSGSSLTGCVNAPDAPNDSLVIAPPILNPKIPKGNICVYYGGRLFVASPINSILYGSKVADLSNFSLLGSGVGDAIEATLEAQINSLRAFPDDAGNIKLMAFVSNNKIVACDVNDDANVDATLFTKFDFKVGVTALNQFSSIAAVNEIYHIDLANQVRSLGQAYINRGMTTVMSDVISLEHESLFRDQYNFSNAHGVIFNNELWMIAKEGTGQNNNRTLIFDIAQKNWRKREDVFANDICLFKDKITFADNSTKRICQLDESLACDGQPFRLSFETLDINNNNLGFKRLRRMRVLGKMGYKGVLVFSAYINYRSELVGQWIISGSDSGITIIPVANSGAKPGFGDSSFGDSMFGGQGNNSVAFFIVDLEMDERDCENFRLVVDNNQSDVYIEIDKIKPIFEVMDDNYFPINFIKPSLITSPSSTQAVEAGAGGINSIRFVDHEIMEGVVDGVNNVFTIMIQPILGSEEIVLEGQELSPLLDYVIVGKTVTFANPPLANISDIQGNGAPRVSYRF